MITRQLFEKDFKDFIESMGDILVKKNHDYTGQNSDPLFNFRKAENMGIPAWKGAMIRLSDKMSRLETFAKKGEFKVEDENFLDTLRDAANYLFLIGELYKEAKHDKTSKTT
jgi:hypothetical protein